MAGKLWNDLRALNRRIPANLSVQEASLGYYYIRFREEPRKLNRLIAGFDEQGIPLNTTYIDVEEKRLHYYPISIGQYALAVFHSWLDTGSADKKKPTFCASPIGFAKTEPSRIPGAPIG
ncbi:MAG: hypothetical protein IPK21_07400 [Haliscomenobacter sp.]|nr:hypothetical protein [Haliscomenobacter sp.]